MNKLFIGSRIVFVLFVFSVLCTAQAPNTFTSGDGGFAIDIPRAGVKVADKEIIENGIEGYGKFYEWSKQGEYYYQVGYYKMESKLTPLQKAGFIKGFKSGILDEAKKNGSASSEKPFVFQRHRGTEIRVALPYGVSITRCFASDTRFYFISISHNTALPEAGAVKILDSFRFLDAAELKRVKIEEAAPDALPQAPSGSKLKSDAEDANLKGKIQNLIEEDIYLPGTRRERSNEKYFNIYGNLTKEIRFTENYPESVEVWGMIEGNRVSMWNGIEFDDDQRPRRKEVIMTLMESPKTPPGGELQNISATIQSDPRYSFRYAYKYDEQGRLSEISIFDNGGGLNDRSTYIYAANQRDLRKYLEDGTEYGHFRFDLDPKGNVIEEISYGEANKVMGRTAYKYEFDAVGNWIIRRSFEKKTVRGKPVLKPISITYRTISYYP